LSIEFGENAPVKPLLLISLLTVIVFSYHIYRHQSVSEQARIQTPLKIRKMENLVAHGMNLETQKTILNCTRGIDAFNGIQGHDFSNLEEFFHQALLPPGIAAKEIKTQSRQIQIVDRDGLKSRFEFRENPKIEARYFKLSEENSPILTALPAALKGLKPTDLINKFKAQGQVTGEEVRETYIWSDLLSAQVLRRNGKIKSLKVLSTNGTLECRETTALKSATSCRCF
jgi:hypothetical protein